MSTIHDMNFLKEKVQELKDQGLYKVPVTLEGPNEAECIIDGRKVINLSSNNYLGFSNHPRLKKAAIAAIETYGAGAGAVRPIIGNMKIHDELEALLAKFKREEAVLTFQSGFNCNAGVIQAVTDKGVFKHSDMADLERVLKEKRPNYRNILIITDGVFSMDGDIAKLPEIVALAEKYECLTYVDDAHASGVLGESGRGSVDHFKLHGRVDFAIGTLSKAIGVVGGYVAGKQVSIDWLKNRGRPFLFSTGLPPAAIGACIEAIKMLMESTEYTDRLWKNARYFKEKLSALGFNTGRSETPITPVIIGEEAKTLEFSKKLFENGLFIGPIVFPTVPKGTGRVRCMVTAGHTTEQLDRAVAIFSKVGKEMGIIR